jgi:hypothetical protein
VQITYRSLAPENWDITDSTLQATQLQSSAASYNAFCFLSPVILANLGGTLSNTLSASTISSSTLMKNSLHAPLTAAEYTAASWGENGWEVESVEIFQSQLKTWVDNNFVSGTVLNPGSQTINVYILDKIIGSTRYLVPIIYVGNTGAAVSNFTKNITLSYSTPLYNDPINTMTGTVTDGASGVSGVTVTAQIRTLNTRTILQSQTATTDGSGQFTLNFTGLWTPNTYVLTWSGTVNGTTINKTRIISVVADPVATVATVTASPSSPTDGTSFTATITVRDQYSNLLSNQSASLTYNGNTQSGTTNGSGEFQANFTATTTALTITYNVDSGTLTGTQAITVESSGVASVTLSQNPDPAIDGNSVQIIATVLNSSAAAVSGASVSLTYDEVTQSGTSNASGEYAASFTANYLASSVSYNINSGSLTGSENIQVNQAPQVVTIVTAGFPSSSTVDTDEVFTLPVTVFDQYNSVIANQYVTVEMNMISVGSGTTNNLGEVTVSCTAPSISGSYSIVAYADSVASNSQNMTVENPAPVATTVNLSLPTQNPIFTTESCDLTATVYDQYDTLMVGQSVNFLVDSVLSTTISTDVLGQAVFTFSAATSGSYDVSATAGSASSGVQSITVNAAPQLASITMTTPSPSSLILSGSFTTTVSTYDQYSNNFGNISVGVYDNDNTLIGSETTDSFGSTEIICTPVKTGTYNVTAKSGTVSSTAQSITVDILYAAGISVYSPSGTNLTLGEFYDIEATVFDQFNSPLLGYSVTFERYDDTNTLVDSVPATTDGFGLATVNFASTYSSETIVVKAVGEDSVIYESMPLTIFFT